MVLAAENYFLADFRSACCWLSKKEGKIAWTIISMIMATVFGCLKDVQMKLCGAWYCKETWRVEKATTLVQPLLLLA